MSPWRPLIVGDLADAVRALVVELGDAIARPEVLANAEPSLAGGQAGFALFHAYVNRTDDAVDALERAIDAMATRKMQPNLYAGFPGVAWTMEHLGDLFDNEGDDPNAAIDEALVDALSRPWRGDYDVINGVTGLGLFGLERAYAGRGTRIVELAIEQLAAMSTEKDGGRTWWTDPAWMIPETREVFPHGYHNMGIAHGVPGAVALLAMALERGITPERTRALLDGSVAWLLANRLPPELQTKTTAVFPYHQEELAAGTHEGTRVAWCYGDPGVAISLLLAGRAAGVAAWEEAGLHAARVAATRPFKDTGVIDAGICHGSAGLAHLFNRLWQATGDERFAEVARRWVEHTIGLRGDKGIGGYQAWKADHFEDTTGYLTGATGIGLALAATIATTPPDWDRPLLVSLAPREP